ncbi:thioester reductase domain-containing protein [Nocardia alba]|uniref:Thioester reductase-like protein n=1 Tax=Nocardia alba TaxID=225051 RepID=A0A4R1FT88_9NOCA|nr:thioester reductase domain-containing protein [Nocardia alba]TCJ96932.1 thioester reductase-like protein [Nocardia alba]
MTTESLSQASASTTGATPDRDDIVRRALIELRTTKRELAQARSRLSEPVAVIGIGCRFPGGVSGADEFWELLVAGGSGVGVVPADRWSIDDVFDADPGVAGRTYSRHGGFLTGVAEFDAALFGVSPREAATMDPQHRLMLEVAWQALEHAGIAPDSLRGSSTGVFVGMASGDYAQLGLSAAGLAGVDAYAATGNSSNFGANRLSYTLGLQGPSVVVDTACSSSLVALHLGCASVRSGESEVVLVGGVNVMSSPVTTVALSKGRMLSASGQCHTFDAAADGYVRGEGCGVVVLKRLSAALADGDRVMAVVRGTAVNQDGKSSGVTVPNGRAQQDVIRTALGAAGVSGSEVGYVEAHGTGTPLGDPIEVRALAAVFGPDRAPEDPLVIGSVKTNIGHLEAAAGIAALIKTVMVLEHGVIAPHRNLLAPNPHVDWSAIPVRVATTITPWTGSDRVAGVSSFGFGGTNAHAVLGVAPDRTDSNATPSGSRTCVAVKVSGSSVGAVRESAALLADFVARRPDIDPVQVARATNVGRADLPERAAVIARTPAELLEGLRVLAEARVDPSVLAPERVSGSPRTAFVVGGGDAADLVGILDGVYGFDPAVTATVDSIVEATDFPISVLLENGAEHRAQLADPTIGRLAEYVVAVAVGLWWRARAVEPEVLVGHGFGRYAAAALAGVFSVIDGARIVAAKTGMSDTTTTQLCAGVSLAAPRIDLLLSDDRELDAARFTTAALWAEWSCAPDEFKPAALEIVARGIDTVIALGVGSLLATFDDVEHVGPRISTLDRDDPTRGMAHAVAALWRAGTAIDWKSATARTSPPITVPHYPFQRERYWIDTHAASTALVSRPLEPRFTSLASGGLVAETTISVADLPFLVEHRVYDEYVVPGVVFIELVLRAGAELLGTEVGIDSIQIKRPLVLRPDAQATVQVSVTGADNAYTAAVHSRSVDGGWHLHLSAQVRRGVAQQIEPLRQVDTARGDDLPRYSTHEFYTDFWHPQFRLGESFQLIDDARGGSGWAEASFTMPASDTRGVRAGIRPELLLLDAAVQLVALAAHDPASTAGPQRPLRLGTGYRRMAMRTEVPNGPIRATATAVAGPNGQLLGDVTLVGSDGEHLGFLEGVSFAQVIPEMLTRMAAAVHSGDAPVGRVDPRAEVDATAIAALPRTERVERVIGYLRAALARITKDDAANFTASESLVERLDSLMLIELKDSIEQAFPLELDTETMFDAASLTGLAGWIADQLPTVSTPQPASDPATVETPAAPERRPRRRRSRLMTVEQMSARALLDPDITATGAPDPDAPAATLLTGATGFVGAYLLDELLRTTDSDVVCLVRAENETHAAERISANLAKYGLDRADHRDRIIPLVGDLAEPRFGLSRQAFDAVHGLVGQILHCGGMVKWTYPYEGLAPANVAGTVEVLRLATVGAPRPVHFISTVGVFSSRTYTADTVEENAELDTSGPLAVGYAQSKWVAEKLVRIAHERGVPTTIHRINTGGDSVTGAFNRQDHLSMMIKGCVEARIAPTEAPMPLQPAPIDYVARGIVALSHTESAVGHTFHLVHPQQLSWAELFGHIADYGYRFDGLSFEAWRDQVVNRRAGTMALVGLTPFLHESVDDVRLPFSESVHTRAALRELDIRCPALDRALIHRYLDAFVASGFLPAPTES